MSPIITGCTSSYQTNQALEINGRGKVVLRLCIFYLCVHHTYRKGPSGFSERRDMDRSAAAPGPEDGFADIVADADD